MLSKVIAEEALVGGSQSMEGAHALQPAAGLLGFSSAVLMRRAPQVAWSPGRSNAGLPKAGRVGQELRGSLHPDGERGF